MFEFFYYSRQWPGNLFERLLRFLHIIVLEIKRYVFGRIYIAEFDLSNDCNLRCKHCYHFRAKNNLSNGALSIEIWEKKFKELYNKGIRRVLLIGGEPAVRIDIIESASRIFPYIDICSNGTIKIPDFYKQKIFVSIDGNRETHDDIRGKGIFDKIIENYKNDNRVVISMTITKENFKQIEFLIKISQECGMKGLSCDVYTPAPNVEKPDEMFISDDIRTQIIDEMWRLKKKYPKSFLMSRKAIRWYAKPNHSETKCYWRSSVIHFNTLLEEKKACDYYDCKYCGHFAGANLSPLNFLLKKTS